MAGEKTKNTYTAKGGTHSIMVCLQVVDYNKFRQGEQTNSPGLLYLLEQVPGKETATCTYEDNIHIWKDRLLLVISVFSMQE